MAVRDVSCDTIGGASKRAASAGNGSATTAQAPPLGESVPGFVAASAAPSGSGYAVFKVPYGDDHQRIYVNADAVTHVEERPEPRASVGFA